MTAKDSAGWRYIGVVAPNGSANVAISRHQTIGRIESHPTQRRQECLHPGVGSVHHGAVMFLGPAVEIPADVATRNAQTAHEGDHDVGKILAYTVTALDGLVNRRIDLSALGHIFEIGIEALV